MVDTPEPSGDQVRIRVRAAGLNRADLMQRGELPAPRGVPANIPGLEYAGEVDKLGPNVIGPLKVGDRVFGIVGGGGRRSTSVSPERMVVPFPPTSTSSRPQRSPKSSSRRTTRSRRKERPPRRADPDPCGRQRCGVSGRPDRPRHGLHRAGHVTHRQQARAGEGTGPRRGDPCERRRLRRRRGPPYPKPGVDLVIDLLGAAALTGNIAALRSCGRLILVGLLGGGSASIDLTTLLRKRIRLIATTLRARPLEEKILATRAFADRVVPWLERGLVRRSSIRLYDLNDIRTAQTRLEIQSWFREGHPPPLAGRRRS